MTQRSRATTEGLAGCKEYFLHGADVWQSQSFQTGKLSFSAVPSSLLLLVITSTHPPSISFAHSCSFSGKLLTDDHKGGDSEDTIAEAVATCPVDW